MMITRQFLMFFSPQYRVRWVFMEYRRAVRQMCKPSLCWSNSRPYYLYLCHYRDLSKNQISEIAEDAFSGLRSLTSL